MSNSSKKTEEPKKSRPKVYVVGGGFDYIRLLYDQGCDGAKGLDDADIVLFTGGEDVDPQLYGEVCMSKTHFNTVRDQKEMAIFEAAVQRKLPMVGICRGGQFLNVMNGGKMWQHVTNHTGTHLARIEIPPFNGTVEKPIRRTINVTSTHHQMMRPTDDAIIVATANVAMEKMSPGYHRVGKGNEADPDIEVVYYDDTHCLCFQPHPELRNCPSECVDFFEECMENFIYPHIPDAATVKAIEDQIPKSIGKKKEKA